MGTPGAFSRGLVMAGAGLLAAALAGCAPARAADATLRVSATVPRFAGMAFTPPASITVSEEDIARGYVDVPQAVELAVKSNVPQGYTLQFEVDGGPVRGARLVFAQGSLLVGPGGAFASRAATGTGLWRDRLEMRIRFELSAAATPGPHPWPLRVGLLPH